MSAATYSLTCQDPCASIATIQYKLNIVSGHDGTTRSTPDPLAVIIITISGLGTFGYFRFQSHGYRAVLGAFSLWSLANVFDGHRETVKATRSSDPNLAQDGVGLKSRPHDHDNTNPNVVVTVRANMQNSMHNDSDNNMIISTKQEY